MVTTTFQFGFSSDGGVDLVFRAMFSTTTTKTLPWPCQIVLVLRFLLQVVSSVSSERQQILANSPTWSVFQCSIGTCLMRFLSGNQIIVLRITALSSFYCLVYVTATFNSFGFFFFCLSFVSLFWFFFLQKKIKKTTISCSFRFYSTLFMRSQNWITLFWPMTLVSILLNIQHNLIWSQTHRQLCSVTLKFSNIFRRLQRPRQHNYWRRFGLPEVLTQVSLTRSERRRRQHRAGRSVVT